MIPPIVRTADLRQRLRSLFPRFLHPRVLTVVTAGCAVLLVVLILMNREDTVPAEAYAWSRIQVRKVIANPEAAEFPPFPSNEVEVTGRAEGTVFAVRANVTTVSLAGLRIRHEYRAELRYHRWQNQWDLLALELE
jgi:hypothetical protein